MPIYRFLLFPVVSAFLMLVAVFTWAAFLASFRQVVMTMFDELGGWRRFVGRVVPRVFPPLTAEIRATFIGLFLFAIAHHLAGSYGGPVLAAAVLAIFAIVVYLWAVRAHVFLFGALEYGPLAHVVAPLGVWVLDSWSPHLGRLSVGSVSLINLTINLAVAAVLALFAALTLCAETGEARARRLDLGGPTRVVRGWPTPLQIAPSKIPTTHSQ